MSSTNPLRVFNGRNRRRFRRRRNWGRIVLRTITALAIVGSLAGGWILFHDLTATRQVQLQVLGVDGEPLRGAVITSPSGKQAVTVEGGIAFLAFETPARIEVAADGYRDAAYTVERLGADGKLDAADAAVREMRAAMDEVVGALKAEVAP